MALPSDAPAQPVNKTSYQALTAVDLAFALDELQVPFIAGGYRADGFNMPQTAELLAALAVSQEARLRLAVIPFLLCHPEIAPHVDVAARLIPPSARVGFKCYYTAAMLLQQKHRNRLDALLGQLKRLPDLFSAELQLPAWSNPDEGLNLLAERQKSLTGRAINWQGTYEHGAHRLLQTLERQTQCQS